MDDRTNLTVSSRKKKLDQLPDAYSKVAIVFTLSDREEWMKRLNRPGKSIPASVLDNMSEIYQEPTLKEGFDEVYVYDGESLVSFQFSDK
jgi:hypothetical protein